MHGNKFTEMDKILPKYERSLLVDSSKSARLDKDNDL